MARMTPPARLTLLLVVALATTTAAQETPSPTASQPPAEASPSEELGGDWRRLAAAPFGAFDLPGGWTGIELVIVDPETRRRAASYLPALDSWSAVARPPRKLLPGSEAHWTGGELLFVEPRGTARHGLTLYDPVADTWRTTSPAPFNEIADSALAGGRIVIAARGGGLATYDSELDSWAELSTPEGMTVRSLHSTGDAALALVTLDTEAALAFVAVDLGTGAWGEPAVGPLGTASAAPLWIGSTFLFLTAPAEPTTTVPTEMAPPLDGAFDPATGSWTTVDVACHIDTRDGIWAEPLVLDIERSVGLDPATGECSSLPLSPWPERTGALRAWTGNEILDVSGDTGGAKPRRDGVAYDPYPGDETSGVVLDKASRPVRVRVPSLGIDLAVIGDRRKVPGSSPGYPACDVALSWSVFDLPGKPGTAWILAHAQEGMFLPLLTTLRAGGKGALLGREVEVQLRDGRLLTYRTYRVDPRATDADIGTRGRKQDEHRLVLQTSTGVGSAPKLLVAARLVDVDTTDEPWPEPRPRACG